MKIKSISLQNFRTFKEKQTLNIENYPVGLHFITGKNLVNIRLAANDSGKSSSVEGIIACFFGKTSTNLKADNIISWEIKKDEFCEVSVILEKLGINYCIQRTWKPNNLVITNINTNEVETITQEKLEEFLSYNFESFLYSTHIAQFTSKFIDLSPAEKMQVFTDILHDELKKWDDLSDLCKNKTEEYITTITKLNTDINFQNGKLEAKSSINYDKEIEKWEKEKLDSLFACDKQIITINKQIKDIENTQIMQPVVMDLTIYDNKIKVCNEEINKLKLNWQDLEKEQNLLCSDLDKVNKNITILNTTLSITKQEYNKFINSRDAICPSCKQIVSKEHIDKETSILKSKIDKIENELVTYEEIKKEYNNEFGKIVKKYEELTKKHDKIKDEKTSIELEKNKEKEKIDGFKLQQILLNNKIELLNKEKASLLDKKTTYKDSVNPFIKLKDENNSCINLYKRLIIASKGQVKEYEESLEPTRYWIKAFKEIKLSVLEEKLKELEIYINNSLNSFGINDWSVTLKTFSETKSGTISNKFNILITSPLNDKPVPFECWGGGLGQRLRLATTLGLMSFIQNSKGDFGVEFFDEPTAWLSQEGIEDLLNILFNRANNENKKIFLIDHKGLNSLGTFNTVTTIIKDKKGSRISI